MSCYFIAQINIEDDTEYQKYLNGFDDVFDKYEGKIIAVEDNPIILEGQWDYSRLVIFHFPNQSEAERWYRSAEYQSILQHRLKASKSTAFLINDRSV